MDKFINKSGDSSRYVVKKNKYDDDDSRSISEKINNSLLLKGTVPTLNSGQPKPKPKLNGEQATKSNSNIDDLLQKIDGMEEKFDENELSEEIDQSDFDNFKLNVKNWIAHDNAMLELDKKRRELLKKRNEYNEHIIEFMKKYKVNDVNIDEVEKLKFDVRNRTCGYTKKTLRENVYQYFTQNKEVADKLLKHLETSRVVKEAENLKRVRK